MKFMQFAAFCLTLSLCWAAVSSAALCPCPRNLAPICGSDRTTYPNDCVFECNVRDAERTGRTLQMAHRGPC